MKNCNGRDYCCQHLLANYTNIYHHVDGVDNIFETILLNFLCTIILLTLLAVLRCIYFRRKQRGNDWNKDWLEFIYSDRKADLLHDGKQPPFDDSVSRQSSELYLHQCLYDYYDMIRNKYPPKDNNSDNLSSSLSSSLKSGTVNQLNSIKADHQLKLDSIGTKRHWLLDYILINETDIRIHRGKDASNYLLFQRYIIYILALLSFVSITILAPVNVYGGNYYYLDNITSTTTYYEMTTIDNIHNTSSLLWIHLIIMIIIVIIGIYMMKKYSDHIFIPLKELSDTQTTILIQNLPKKARDARNLKKFIESNFPNVQINRIIYAYNVKQIVDLKKKLKSYRIALNYCIDYQRHYQRPFLIRRSCMFTLLCPRCPSCGICYYQHRIDDCQRQIESKIRKLLNHPQHAAFVQMKNSSQAQEIVEHFEATQHTRLLNTIQSSMKKLCKYSYININNFDNQNYVDDDDDYDEDDPYGYNKWIVKLAPHPEDVEWNDIVMNNRTYYVWSLLLNLLTIIIFLFLTTPIVGLNFLQEIFILRMNLTMVDNINIGFVRIKWLKYFSALIINGLSCLLPNLIMLIELFVPQTRKSEKNSKIMKMVYLYLILMVLIFPSLGLMSGQYLIKKITDNSFPRDFYKCLFPATRSQFFIYYVISCIFINNPAQLLRLPELGLYLFNLIIYCPKTDAEYGRARMETNFQFNYGSNYPRFLLIFTIVITYSIASPLLAPLGLLYMLTKHLIDRYHIYYLYSTTQIINSNIHQNAILFVLISFFFPFLQLTTYLNNYSNYYNRNYNNNNTHNTKNNRNNQNRQRFSIKTTTTNTLIIQPSNISIIIMIIYIIFLLFVCFNFDYFYDRKLLLSSTATTTTTKTSSSPDANDDNNNNDSINQKENIR